uniref:NADH dehydrogenase subunit 3 n=1 Tax=Sicista caudata TaxID=2599793 RepID=UPI0030FF3583
MNLLISLFTNTELASVLIMVAFWLPQISMNWEKVTPYECGFDPIESAHLPFSMKFFLEDITFLLFDLEIALLLPLPWATQVDSLKLMLAITLILISILAAKRAYEWTQKGVEWEE